MAASKFTRMQLSLLAVFLFLTTTQAQDPDFPAIFNFGDSNSDTGNFVAGLGVGQNPPYGETFFWHPNGRFCNGRLIIDFLGEAFHMSLINPYLDSLNQPNFQSGCNFASAGSTIHHPGQFAVSPFSLHVQIAQFIRFKEKAIEMLAAGRGSQSFLPTEETFNQSLYMFDIGQNDLDGAFYSMSEDEVNKYIPTVISLFGDGIQKLYTEGARRFWIHNTGPLGCLPKNIARFGKDPSNLDHVGCVAGHNRVARLFNSQLHNLTSTLQTHWTDANFIYMDIYSIKADLIANYSTYGFEQRTMACCGHGGPPLNYDKDISCGKTVNRNGILVTAAGCGNATKYVNWDGVHYTEAANSHVASRVHQLFQSAISSNRQNMLKWKLGNINMMQ